MKEKVRVQKSKQRLKKGENLLKRNKEGSWEWVEERESALVWLHLSKKNDKRKNEEQKKKKKVWKINEGVNDYQMNYVPEGEVSDRVRLN